MVEIDADDRIAALVTFDLDDIDAAFEELDARYLAGEAAPYSDTWSVITRGYAALNRREIPATITGLGEHRSPSIEQLSSPATYRHTFVPCGTSLPTSRSTSRPFIG